MTIEELLKVIANGDIDVDAEVYYDTGEEEFLIESAEVDPAHNGLSTTLVLK